MQCQDNPRWAVTRNQPWLQCLGREWARPPRSLAADAHDCIMVRSHTALHRIQGCGADRRPPGRLALDRLVLRCFDRPMPPRLTLIVGRRLVAAARIRAKIANKTALHPGQPSTSVAEYGRVRTPVKAGLRPPPPAAGGLDRGSHPAIVSHQVIDGKLWLNPAQSRARSKDKRYCRDGGERQRDRCQKTA
jgi:hypothetical protein